MKKLQDQLKEVSAALAKLSKQVDKINTQVKKLEQGGKKTAKKAVAKKAVKKAAPAKKKTVKKAAPAKKAAAKSTTVLDSVFSVIKRSRAGVSIATIKEKTQLNPRQLSNALYKLTKRGKVTTKSRGVYVKS